MKTGDSRKDKETIKTICNDLTNPVSSYCSQLSASVNLFRISVTQLCNETADTQDVDSVSVLRCDADKDGKCEGEVEEYNHLYFNCLAADVPGQPSTHNFCKYHYDNATNCPVHPCFVKTYY